MAKILTIDFIKIAAEFLAGRKPTIEDLAILLENTYDGGFEEGSFHEFSLTDGLF